MSTLHDFNALTSRNSEAALRKLPYKVVSNEEARAHVAVQFAGT